ncbi:zinc ribbon domain-containing protein [Candidatus Allofournierella merdavium]|uniref:zinc ribbon domain-containing protein n=1 Tax=Candidatus Allofournierella merdavium TaxID=2838593 RepID=UPI00374F3625
MNVNIDIDRILEAGVKVVDSAKKTATDLAREGKRQTDLLALQGKKSKAERQLGALVYSLAKNGEENRPLVEKYIAAIGALDDKIRELKSQPAAEGEAPVDVPETPVKNCPQCGREVDEDALFCPGCGAQL